MPQLRKTSWLSILVVVLALIVGISLSTDAQQTIEGGGSGGAGATGATGATGAVGAVGATGATGAAGPAARFLANACTGTATSSQTLFILFYAPGACSTTSEGPGAFWLVPGAGTIANFRVRANVAGVNASSGLVTVRLNGADTTVACTVGTGTTCTSVNT
jgi:hypothetical protein